MKPARLRLLLSALAILGLVAVPAAGQQYLQRCWITTLRNNCWPQPFVVPDRQAARLPMQLMIQNGWQRQNLLDEHHFQPGSTELTGAGKLKIEWIVREAPQQHRTIYVRVAKTAEETADRLDLVRHYATEIAIDGRPPEILATTVRSPGWPARQVDAIGRKFESAIPEPVLPASQSAGETSE